MTKFNILICSAAMLMLVFAPGCKANNEQASKSASTEPVVVPAGGQQAAPAQMPPQQPSLEGKIVETMDASGYTYVNLETASGSTWAAMPQTKVEVGQQVALSGGMPMSNFESKTLGRTFDTIIFSGGIVQGGGAAAPAKTAALPPGHESFSDAMQGEAGAATPQSMGNTSGGSSAATAEAEEVKVEKAEGDNAYTVGEIFAKRTDLDKQKVLIRGKVVKYSPMIMGKNWIHLQDGTGDAASKTHDLVVTTMAEAEKGAVVIIEGTVSADKDFGSGYRYDVIVEEAAIK